MVHILRQAAKQKKDSIHEILQERAVDWRAESVSTSPSGVFVLAGVFRDREARLGNGAAGPSENSQAPQCGRDSLDQRWSHPSRGAQSPSRYCKGFAASRLGSRSPETVGPAA
jgi:hypothetical protein